MILWWCGWHAWGLDWRGDEWRYERHACICNVGVGCG